MVTFAASLARIATALGGRCAQAAGAEAFFGRRLRQAKTIRLRGAPAAAGKAAVEDGSAAGASDPALQRAVGIWNSSVTISIPLVSSLIPFAPRVRRSRSGRPGNVIDS